MAYPTENFIRAELFGKTEQVAQFVEGSKLDPVSTDREGHAVYRSQPFVTVRAKGERDCICVPVTKEHQLQFAQQWREFVDRTSRATQSDLLHLPTINLAIVRTLHELGIFTVEMLADAEIVDRVEVAIEPSGSDDAAEDADEILRPGLLPRHLEAWQPIARHYITLKTFATTGEKPRTRLEQAA